MTLLGEEHDAVTRLDVCGAVGGEHDGDPLPCQAAEDGEHLRRGRGVEARCRLVQQEQPGTGQELDRRARSLALAPRERTDSHVRPIGEMQVVQGRRHGLPDLVARGAAREAERRREAQGPAQGQLAVDDVVLGHVADGRASCRLVDGHAVVQHGPGGGPAQSGHDLQQGRLAGAAAAGEGDQLAPTDRQRDAVQHLSTTDVMIDADDIHPSARRLVRLGPGALGARPLLDDGVHVDPFLNQPDLGPARSGPTVVAGQRHRR